MKSCHKDFKAILKFKSMYRKIQPKNGAKKGKKEKILLRGVIFGVFIKMAVKQARFFDLLDLVLIFGAQKVFNFF